MGSCQRYTEYRLEGIMRAIKFRAWLAEDRYMGEVTSLHTGDGAYVRTTGETPYCKLYEIELMQFTGLKDCNGAEIYQKAA